MFKKSWLMAMSLCCVAGMTLSACGDDASKSREEDMDACSLTISGATCNSANVCSLNAYATEDVKLSASVACGKDIMSGVDVVVSAAENIIVNGEGNQATVKTDELGSVSITLNAQRKEDGNVTITTSPKGQELKAIISVSVDEKAQEEKPSVCTDLGCDKVTAQDAAYNACVQLECIEGVMIESRDLSIKVVYEGDQNVTGADATLFNGKTCADVVKDAAGDLTEEQISNLTVNGGKAGFGAKTADGISIKIANVMDTEANTAVVARGMAGAQYVAYGCADLPAVSSSSNSVTVTLKDGDIPEPEVDWCHELDCTNNTRPGTANYAACLEHSCNEPNPEAGYYTGTYALMSQFNALKLLPNSGKASPAFNEMLAGDWIEWSLDLLKDPAKKVPSIVTDQVLPLILNVEWLHDLVVKIGGESVAAILTPEVIGSLLDTFGVKTIIQNYIDQFLGQFEWWSTTSNIITIASDIATKFTLAGYIYVMDAPDDSSTLPKNYHSYNSLVYNGAKFADADGNVKCFFGDVVGEDASGNILCGVSLGELDASIGSINGEFKAKLDSCDSNDFTSNICGSADIMEHSLKMAYGRIVYDVILKAITSIVDEDVKKHVNSLGTLIEYYAGYGLVMLWNSEADKFNEENAEAIAAGEVKAREKISEKTTMCSGISDAATRFVGLMLAGSSWETLIKTWLKPETITPLCTMGIQKIDSLISTQLNKLTAGSEQITFKSSKPCKLLYDTVDGSRLASFGPQDYTWGQTTDNRCDWDLSFKSTNEVATGEVDADGNPIKKTETKVYTVPGKFFAVRTTK